MMIDLQKATAEITASTALCVAVRDNPQLLDQRYSLTAREKRQLLAMANHPGMQASCTLYRINRLVPLIMNLPQTIEALGSGLEPLLVAYWEEHSCGYRYSYVECERFCNWLRERSHLWGATPDRVRHSLAAEESRLQANLLHVMA
ncbi:MAG: hypothetical protein ACKO28_08530 [Cyanobium sp.]